MRVARVPVPDQARQKSSVKTFPAPIRGWVVNENLALAQAGGAKILENWFPTPTGVRVRGGSPRYATLGTGPVVLMNYDGGGLRKLFGAEGGSIYDITTVADAAVIPTAAVTGQTSNNYSYANMATVGGGFLIVVNGEDEQQLFDGVTWQAVNDASLPIAITGVDTSTLSDVWVYRNRVLYVGQNMTAWYLPVDSVGGAALDFSLAGVFKRGGRLLFGATWSLDAGDGIDDKCVFVSDTGEVAIYEGSNPADPDDWRMVGRYEIGRPLGKRAKMTAGGDLLVATEEGLVPISAAIQKDRAALSLASVSRPIAPEWSKEAASRFAGWEILKWPGKQMGIVGLPASPGQDHYSFIVNLETGAWAKYTAWDIHGIALHEGQAFFGTGDGAVRMAEVGGYDDGMPYNCTYVGQFDHLGRPGPIKNIRMARATFLSGRAFRFKVSGSVNYKITLPAPLPSTPEQTIDDVWDAGLWDVAKWDAGPVKSVSSRWISIGRTGFTFAPQIQITCGLETLPDAEIVSIDVTYETGGLVV